MKRRLVFLLVIALAVEGLNFWRLTPPIDVGYPPGTSWWIQAIGAQWVLLHAPALYLLDWYEHASGCQQRNIPGGCGTTDTVFLLAAGWLDTVLLLALAVFTVKRSIRLIRSRRA